MQIDTDSLNKLTDDDMSVLFTKYQEEQQRRATLESSANFIRQTSLNYQNAVKLQDPVDFSLVQDPIGPGYKVIWTDGKTYINKTMTWLPKIADPSAFPAGWDEVKENV